MQTYADWYAEKRARLEAEDRALTEELTAIMATTTEEDINKRFLKDFGCINFQTNEFMHELKLARKWHDIQIKKHPELHDKHETEPYNCYHKIVCKCGFSEACDSSD